MFNCYEALALKSGLFYPQFTQNIISAAIANSAPSTLITTLGRLQLCSGLDSMKIVVEI